MRNNEKVALSTSKVLLVPYSKPHVLQYHEWMQDREIQEATASEPLTLDEEYAMRQSWRQDPDKLTFIICQPPVDLAGDATSIKAGLHDGNERMIGDVNMFISVDDADGEGTPKLIGELELMIASNAQRGQGLGRSALLVFLRYIMEHESEITDEFLFNGISSLQNRKISCFCVKIGQQNLRSIGLFESLGFIKSSEKPNYFGEFDLRLHNLTLEGVTSLLLKYKIEGYKEMVYESEDL